MLFPVANRRELPRISVNIHLAHSQNLSLPSFRRVPVTWERTVAAQHATSTILVVESNDSCDAA